MRYLRSLVTGAGPIKEGDTRYDNIKDNPEGQDEVLTRFSKTLRNLANSGEERYSNVERRIWGRLLYNVVYAETTQGDVAWAIGSTIFVFFYIWFHLGSVFMAFTSMLMISLSFPISYLFYSGLFQISMNTTLNQLNIFIVLGIAADDIFVFCDAWQQS